MFLQKSLNTSIRLGGAGGGGCFGALGERSGGG